MAPVIPSSYSAPQFLQVAVIPEDVSLLSETFDDLTEDKDKFILPAAAGFLGEAVAKAFGDALFSRAKQFVGDKVFDAVFGKGKRILNGIAPPALTPQQQQMFETLYSSTGFSQGVESLLNEQPDLTPAEAVRTAFEFLYRYDPKHPLAQANQSPYIVWPEDIAIIREKYGLSGKLLFNIAQIVNEDYGWQKEYVWSDIFNALFTANMTDRTGVPQPQNLAVKITETQEIFLKDLQRDAIRQELGAIKGILNDIGQALNSTPTSNGGIEKITLWDNFTINIGPEVTGKPIGRYALVQYIEGVVVKIESGRPLSKSDEEFITRLKDKNPALQKVIDSKTHHTNTAIAGTNLALEMLRDVQKGKNLWFAQVMMEVSGSQELTQAGVVVQNKDGVETARYEFTYNANCPYQGKYLGLFVEGGPHPIPPYTFEKGHVMIVRGGTVTIEDAIRVTDGRQRSFFITHADIEQFRTLAREALTNEAVRKSPIGRAFLRFFNQLQAVCKMVYGEGFEPEPGSPQKTIEKTANNLARENWAIQLEQELDRIGRESRGAEGVGKKYSDQFGKKDRDAFQTEAKKLERAILDKDVQAKNEAISAIRLLLAKQVGGTRQADKISLDLYSEVTEWKKVDFLEEYLGTKEPSDELRMIIIARGVEPSGAARSPTLARAREFATDGSYDRAMIEYGLLVADPNSNVLLRMTALSEAAQLSVDKLQIPRARRLAGRIRALEANGATIPDNIKPVVEMIEKIPINGETKAAPIKTNVAPIVEGETAYFPDFDIVATDECQPMPIKVMKKGAALTAEIGGNAVFSSAIFLTSGAATRLFFSPPQNEIEAVIQGYGTMGNAMVGEHVVRKGMDYAVWHGISNPAAAPAPFSTINFASGLLAIRLIYSGLYNATDAIEIDEAIGESVGPFGTNEAIALTGTGMVYGGASTAFRLAAPNLALDLSRSAAVTKMLAAEPGWIPVYASRWSPTIIKTLNILKPAAAAALVVDIGTSLANGMIGSYDSHEKSFIVQDCANAIGMPGVSFLIPSFYKLYCRIGGGSDIDWYAGHIRYQNNSADARAIEVSVGAALIKGLAYEMQKAIDDTDGKRPTLEDLMRKTAENYSYRLDFMENFQTLYQNEFDKNWMFRIDAVHDGKIEDAKAIAFWLGPYIEKLLGMAEDAVGSQAEALLVEGEDITEQEDALETLAAYRDELDGLSSKYLAVRPDNIWPERLR